ncbi:hypothetical protein M0802_000278 [Mischocyttarus mexicanus]|nr:hypothetical protein M0802_000278 [Mischocyttarus mexicanus]
MIINKKKINVSTLKLNRFIIEFKGARFRDTSQQIHKQWQADPVRAFPTVGSVTTSVGGGGSPSPASGDISTPNSTPSPSPSPTNGQLVMAKTIGMQVVHPIEPYRGWQPSRHRR